MVEISQSRSSREAAEIALWQMPSPEPGTATMSAPSRLDPESQEQVVGNVAVGDGGGLPDLGSLSSFGSWENVAGTLLFKTATMSGFDQGSLDFDPVVWGDFLTRFSTIPFFLSYTSDYRDASISKTSLKKIIDAVSDLVENIMTSDNLKDVATTVKKMAALAVRSEKQPKEVGKQKVSNQQLGVLSCRGGVLHLGVVRTEVKMECKSGKGYEQLNQTLTIYCGYGVLDFDKCKRHSDTLLGWDRKNVDDWVRGANSYAVSPNDSPAWNN